jgi:hypothetical protein
MFSWFSSEEKPQEKSQEPGSVTSQRCDSTSQRCDSTSQRCDSTTLLEELKQVCLKRSSTEYEEKEPKSSVTITREPYEEPVFITNFVSELEKFNLGSLRKIDIKKIRESKSFNTIVSELKQFSVESLRKTPPRTPVEPKPNPIAIELDHWRRRILKIEESEEKIEEIDQESRIEFLENRVAYLETQLNKLHNDFSRFYSSQTGLLARLKYL